MSTSSSRIAALFFDIVIAGLLMIWLAGGISFHDHLYLKHGADLRRAAWLFAFTGFWCGLQVRRESLILRTLTRIGDLLLEKNFRWTLFGFSFVWAVLLAIAQTNALRVTMYDVGIFHQILWSLSHSLGFHSTISEAGNFLKDHFSPSLGLLVPFFKISGGSPYFLPVAQAILIFGGAAAWIFLAERCPGAGKEFRRKLAAAVCLFAINFDSLWGNLRWGFHENALAFISLSWALAFLFADVLERTWFNGNLKKIVILILFLIAAFSKETLLLDVGIALILWALLERPSRKNFAFSGLLILVALGLFFQFRNFETILHPADKNYFDRYYSYLGHDLHGVLFTLIHSPVSIVRAIGVFNLLKYFWIVFLPWLFLPFLGGAANTIWLLAILPSWMSAALSTYPPLRSANFHYVLELWPFLAVITILALARFRSIKLVWIWALLALFWMDHDPWRDLREYISESIELSAARVKLQGIPESASVSADELTGTWLAGRKLITRWPDLGAFSGGCPEFIVIAHDQSACKGSLLWQEGAWRAYRVGD